jgi:CRISPR type III-A-associated protein Csm2
MASLEDALKKAGLSSAEAAEPEKPAAAATPAPVSKTPEVVEERPCTKCGTVFLPKLGKHKLCPKCAEEHFTAAKAEKTDKPKAAGEKPAGPRPERRDRPPRREGGRPEGGRPEAARADAPKREPREPRREPVQREAREPREPRREVVQREAPQGFPRDYLAAGYFSGNVMRDELFDTWARHVAGLLVSRGLSAKELRAFYGHVQRAADSAKAGRDFGAVREEILKMRPVAAARLGRKMIPAEFSDFLDRNIEQVKDNRTLGAFVEHFQGVVGYTAGKLKK